MATKEAVTTPFTSPVTTAATNNTTAAVPRSGREWTTPDMWNRALLSLAIGSSLEAILILSSNIALLLLIVTSPSMRKQMKYHLVLSLVCTHILVGLFSSPALADFAVRRIWMHNCYLTVIRSLLADYVQVFIALWGLVLLLLHYMARVLRYEGPTWMVRLPSWLLKALPGLIVASPWIVAAMLQTPVVFFGLHPYTLVMWDTGRCPFLLTPWASFILATAGYFIPAIILVTLAVIILVRFKDSDNTNRDQLHRTEIGATLVSAEKEEMESGKVHVAVALLSVLMIGPEHVFRDMRVVNLMPWQVAIVAGVFILLLSDLAPFVLAMVWLTKLPEVRARGLELAARLPCCAAWCRRTAAPAQTTGATSAAPVSFRDLRDGE